MPASPCQRPQDETTAPRSPRSTTTLIAVLIAAETAVCTTATNAEQPLVAPIVPPAPVCEGTPMTAPTAAVSNSPIDALDDELRRKVCSFLNWRECLDLKPLNKAWNAASEDVVRMDVLPDTTTPTPAVFLTCPSGLVSDAPVEALLRCQHPSKWRCAMCGFCNSETRILCGNRACQIPCPTHRDCARLFLGQLRREGTVGTLKWLVESVLGDPKTNPVTIVNIENHRQLTTSRGKGCAWVYLQHRSMADAVLGHNHRAFFDVHPVTGREGVWIVGAGAEAALQECVKVRGYVRGRDLLLPRNALVVEYPSRQPNQSWASSSSNMPYATSSPTTAVAPSMPTSAGKGSATPDSNWYPATDSPPSESSTENHMPSSTSPTHAARGRRHQPYGTPNAWTPTAAGMPSLPPGEFPQLPPQMATTTGYLETTDAYFQHPDYDAYYATYYTAQPTGHRHRGWRAAYHGQQHMYTTAYYPQQAMYATATY